MADEPQFDYSNYSRADQRRIMDLQMQAQWRGVQIDENARSMSLDEFEQVRGEYMALMDDIEQMQLAYVTSVPADWFVTSAPDGIDINTPDWWLYVRADKLRDLKSAAVEARSPSAVSGE